MIKKLLFIFSFIFWSSASYASHPVVKTGIEVLREHGFKELKGKRVGLVTNPSGVDSKLKSTIDILFEAPEVNLVALFGPEHGVRGDVYLLTDVYADLLAMKDDAEKLPVRKALYMVIGLEQIPAERKAVMGLEGLDKKSFKAFLKSEKIDWSELGDLVKVMDYISTNRK